MVLAELDNPADTLITLRISGNRLVHVCNALQQMLYETKRLQAIGDGFEATPGYTELNEIVERIRDELSAQRCAKQ